MAVVAQDMSTMIRKLNDKIGEDKKEVRDWHAKKNKKNEKINVRHCT